MLFLSVRHLHCVLRDFWLSLSAVAEPLEPLAVQPAGRLPQWCCLLRLLRLLRMLLLRLINMRDVSTDVSRASESSEVAISSSNLVRLNSILSERLFRE